MKDIITSREELLLAKIAGRDVNLETMTPPVASNMTEKLMLEIAERIDNIGGGSDESTYEVVAEIEVGEMTPDGSDGYYFAPDGGIDLSANTGTTYYLNSEDNASSAVVAYGDDYLILFNGDPQTQRPIDPDKPVVSVITGDHGGIFSTTDLSNTTVRILKAASEPSGGLPEVTAADNGDVLTVVEGVWSKAEPNPNLKPTYEFGITVTVGTELGTFELTPNEGVTYAAITAALAVTPNVYFSLSMPNAAIIVALVNQNEPVDDTVAYVAAAFVVSVDFGCGRKFYGVRAAIYEDGHTNATVTALES